MRHVILGSPSVWYSYESPVVRRNYSTGSNRRYTLTAIHDQMPYEAISEEQYKSQTAKLQKLDFKRWEERPPGGDGGREGRIEEVPDKFCETDACTTSVSARIRVAGGRTKIAQRQRHQSVHRSYVCNRSTPLTHP